MNSNLDAYLEHIVRENGKALESAKPRISIAEALPCLVCRELEAPSNRFVDSSDPFLMSFRALRRNQGVPRPAIPRKIEFGSAVYLKEGIIDSIFPNSPVPVTLIFIGDGNSDKRFAYNTKRLFSTFKLPFKFHCFILNPGLLYSTPPKRFGGEAVKAGWDESRFFYHASNWSELKVFNEVFPAPEKGRAILIVDLDGTLFCPRPNENSKIQAARNEAIVSLCHNIFDAKFFDARKPAQVEELKASYASAATTIFSQSYDDEDLTMLIALGLFAKIIDKDDALLNPRNDVGFVTPIEWLQYAAFLIENHPDPEEEYRLRQLRSLYVRCADTILRGLPSSFPDFRREEEKVLIAAAKKGEIVLNRTLLEFIHDSAKKGVVPIGFSDRPNACLGLSPTSSPAYTVAATELSLFHTPLALD